MNEDPLPPSADLREMRKFMGRMMTFWTFIFPAWFAFSGVSKALEMGWVWAVLIGGFWVFVFFFAWTVRRLFKALMVTQDLHEEVGYLELVERKARVEQREARRIRAEARLARIHHDQEQQELDEAAADLAQLALDLSSDSDPPTADT